MLKSSLLSILVIFILHFGNEAQSIDAPGDFIQPSGNIKSIPLFVKADQSKDYNIKLNSGCKKPDGFTMEMSANPEWYSILCLPSLIDHQNESNVEILNGFFANSVALYLLNKEVGLDVLLKKWENEPPSENAENMMHRRVGKMFDTVEINNRMADEISKLEQSQLPDGSWPWYPGMKSSRYITQLMCIGIGRLFDMHIYDNYSDKLNDMGVKAFKYCDNEMTNDYNDLESQKANMNDNHLTFYIISYLYSRTFWNVPIEYKCEKPLYYWQEQAWTYWQNRTLKEKAMLVSAFYRQGEDSVYIKMFRSIDKQAIHDVKSGVYWKDNTGSDAHKAETQASVIEGYNIWRFPWPEPETMYGLKQWLLAQKKQDQWASDEATVDAIYALNQNNNIPVIMNKTPKISVGNMLFDSSAGNGSGFVYHDWTGQEIKHGPGKIKIENTTDYPAMADFSILYDAKYQGTTSDIPGLKIKKTVYFLSNINPSSGWKKLSKNKMLQKGDSIKIVIDLKADKELNYIHVQNRISPSTQLSDSKSGIKKINNLVLYKNVTDNDIDFYIEKLKPQTYILDFTMSVIQSGKFQNGGISVEEMY